MTEKWELCIVSGWDSPTFYTPDGYVPKQVDFIWAGGGCDEWPKLSRNERVAVQRELKERPTICRLLAEGWEPLGLAYDGGLAMLAFRRRYREDAP